MWRTLFNFLGDLGEGGIVALVLFLMVVLVIIPTFWPFLRLAAGN